MLPAGIPLIIPCFEDLMSALGQTIANFGSIQSQSFGCLGQTIDRLLIWQLRFTIRCFGFGGERTYWLEFIELPRERTFQGSTCWSLGLVRTGGFRSERRMSKKNFERSINGDNCRYFGKSTDGPDTTTHLGAGFWLPICATDRSACARTVGLL